MNEAYCTGSMEYIAVKNDGGMQMKIRMKDKNDSYVIEREFLSRISTEELISRIIKAHVSSATDQETSQEAV